MPFDPTKCRKLTQQAFFNVYDGGSIELKTNAPEAGWDSGVKDAWNQYTLASFNRRVENLLVDLTGKLATTANGLMGSLLRVFASNPATIGRIEFVNCGFINCGRAENSGAHTEGMYVRGPKVSSAPGLELVFTSCKFHSGTVFNGAFVEDGYGWHWEEGSADLLRFVDTEISWRADIALSAGHTITRIEHQGCRSTGQYYKDGILTSRNPQPSFTFTKRVGYTGGFPVVVETAPPPPPVDLHASCQQALANMTAERDDLQRKIEAAKAALA